MGILIDLEKDGRYLAENTELCGGYAYGATQEEALAKIRALTAACTTIDTREWREWLVFFSERLDERDWNELMAEWRAAYPAKAVLDALLRDGWKLTGPEGAWRVIEWPGEPEYRHYRTCFPFQDGDMLGPVLLARLAIHLELRKILLADA
jgi:hypothetical protein